MEAAEGPQRSALVKKGWRCSGDSNAATGPTAANTHAYNSATTPTRRAASSMMSGGSGVEELRDGSAGPGIRPRRAGATLRLTRAVIASLCHITAKAHPEA